MARLAKARAKFASGSSPLSSTVGLIDKEVSKARTGLGKIERSAELCRSTLRELERHIATLANMPGVTEADRERLERRRQELELRLQHVIDERLPAAEELLRRMKGPKLTRGPRPW